MPGSYNFFALSQSMSPGMAEQTPPRTGWSSAASCPWLMAGLVRNGFLLCRRGHSHTALTPGHAVTAKEWSRDSLEMQGAAPRGSSVSPVWNSSGNGSLTTVPPGAFWHTAVPRSAWGRHHPTPSCLRPWRGRHREHREGSFTLQQLPA